MRRYVLDTHTLIWSLTTPKKLGRGARRAFEDIEKGRGKAWIPAIVGAEVTLLHQLGRTTIGLPELQQILEESSGFELLTLDLPQLQQFSALLGIRDAFDRLIVAAARHLDAKLITCDHTIAESGLVGVVWD